MVGFYRYPCFKISDETYDISIGQKEQCVWSIRFTVSEEDELDLRVTCVSGNLYVNLQSYDMRNPHVLINHVVQHDEDEGIYEESFDNLPSGEYILGLSRAHMGSPSVGNATLTINTPEMDIGFFRGSEEGVRHELLNSFYMYK